jgi:hypothetical protein
MSDYGSTPPPPPGGGNYPPPPPGGGGYSAPPPAPGYGGAMSSPPPNYLVWAILSTIFCCLPLGIASIVFAAQVNGKWQAGDAAGAQESSAKAKKFAIWAAIAGIIGSVLYLVLVVALGMGIDGTDSSTM